MKGDFREALRAAREERAAEEAAAAAPVTMRAEREREERDAERLDRIYHVVYDIRSILLFWLVIGLLGAGLFVYRAIQAQ